MKSSSKCGQRGPGQSWHPGEKCSSFTDVFIFLCDYKHRYLRKRSDLWLPGFFSGIRNGCFTSNYFSALLHHLLQEITGLLNSLPFGVNNYFYEERSFISISLEGMFALLYVISTTQEKCSLTRRGSSSTRISHTHTHANLWKRI